MAAAHIDKNSYWITHQPLRSTSPVVEEFPLTTTTRSTKKKQPQQQQQQQQPHQQRKDNPSLLAPLPLSKETTSSSSSTSLLQRSHSYVRQRKQAGKKVFPRRQLQRSESCSLSNRSRASSSPSSVMFHEEHFSLLKHLQHPLAKETLKEKTRDNDDDDNDDDEESLSDILGAPTVLSNRWSRAKAKMRGDYNNEDDNDDDNSADTERKSNLSTTSYSPVPTMMQSQPSFDHHPMNIRVRFSQSSDETDTTTLQTNHQDNVVQDQNDDDDDDETLSTHHFHAEKLSCFPDTTRTCSKNNSSPDCTQPTVFLEQIRSISQEFTSHFEVSSLSSPLTTTTTTGTATEQPSSSTNDNIYSPPVTPINDNNTFSSSSPWYQRAFQSTPVQPGTTRIKTPLDFILCGAMERPADVS